MSTILIVDDSLTVRMDLVEAFEAAGLSVRPCRTLAEARQVLAGAYVVAAVLDVNLPDGDGIELLREIRASDAGESIAVLMLSSEADIRDRLRGLKTGANEYVGKPYDRDYVVAKVRELTRAHAPPEVGAMSVLLIDDSLTFRRELGRMLVSAGYAVVEAGSGEDGLRAAATRRPGAVVVDGVLPGIDGAAVIRRLRLDAALRDVPCVLLTGSEGAAELHALESGADAFMRKEEDPSVILAKLRAVLRRAAPRPSAAETVSLLGPRKILAVDDSATYLHELAQSLGGEGYDVVLARSAAEALELLAVQPVDCILLDLEMPGVDGGEACRRLKATPRLRDIPVAVLTGHDDRQSMLDSLDAGADDFILKSNDFAVLKARVRAQIRRKQVEDENRRAREEALSRELAASEARASTALAEARAALVEELERKNKELEAFSYSVSHDLRAPLRAIDGFSHALLEGYGGTLDDKGLDYLRRVRRGAERMGQLIDDMLQLFRVARAELTRGPVDVSRVAHAAAADLARLEPQRQIDLNVQEGLSAIGDANLLRIVFDNLLGNAWKFAGKADRPRVEVGADDMAPGRPFFVRDNGAGFDMKYAEKLFRPFQRLHTEKEFPGTGVGLATVHKVIDRLGGRIWAEGAVGQGATFYFTLPSTVPGGGRSR
jgi:DNA-binding response OmpR family regulator